MRPPAFTVTESAMKHINSKCSDGSVLVVSVNGKGCSGHSYEYSIALPSSLEKGDELVTWDGGGVAVKAKSMLYMLGSILDVKGNCMEEHLEWRNPNATNFCGCGASFSFRG